MSLKSKIVLLLLFLCNSALAANILYVAPVASPSHHIWNKAFALGLVKNGHNITMLTHEVDHKLLNNFTVITMEGIYEAFHKEMDVQEISNDNVFNLIKILYDLYGLFTCQFDYNTTALQTLLNYPENYKFDLIIYDASISRCMYPLTERFGNPPVLAVTPFLFPPILSDSFGNHLYTSYIPHYSTTFTNQMTIYERLRNFIYTYFEIFYWKLVYLPQEECLINEKFKEMKHSIDELERNISLLLCNVDPVMDYPQALPPNIIPVGGLHARPSNPLPKDLEKIIKESKDGIILFSLGTNVRSDQLSLKTRQELLKAFAKLPQSILWKFESDNMDTLPKNVFIRKWLPQNDIIGHPKTKLLINHGGALSSQEAIYHGVPIVGIPHFLDQESNIKKLVKKGVAVYLNKDNLTMESVYEAISIALKSASINMRELSKKYRDQPLTALERGVFWAEYLLRHGSAEHLVSPARDMPLYQTANVDVILLVIVSLMLLYSAILLLINFCKLFKSVDKITQKVKTVK